MGHCGCGIGSGGCDGEGTGRRGRRPLQLKAKVVLKAKCGGLRAGRPTEQQRKSERDKGGGSPPPTARAEQSPAPTDIPFPQRGFGALGGAQRAPPASKAGPLVRLLAPQGQTLFATPVSLRSTVAPDSQPRTTSQQRQFSLVLSFVGKRKNTFRE